MITKLLCKYLDRDGKGYVTMGSMITAASGLAGISLLIAMCVNGGIIAMEDCNAGILIGESSTLFECLCIIGFAAATMVAVMYAAAFVIAFSLGTIEYVWTAKIVKCERKDGDET